MKKYTLWFTFADTTEQAQAIIDDYNRTATAWQKKKYPAHATEWSSIDGKEQKIIVWTSR
jgi:hypothetical protein